MDWLITSLAQHKSTYRIRPCVEGYCWSGLFTFMTPHRSRIDRRIEAFKGERTVHESECKDFLRDQDKLERKEESVADRTLKRAIAQNKIDSQERIAKEEIAARSRSTEVVETKTQRHGLHR